jgi:hypothetical protein
VKFGERNPGHVRSVVSSPGFGAPEAISPKVSNHEVVRFRNSLHPTNELAHGNFDTSFFGDLPSDRIRHRLTAFHPTTRNGPQTNAGRIAPLDQQKPFGVDYDGTDAQFRANSHGIVS